MKRVNFVTFNPRFTEMKFSHDECVISRSECCVTKVGKFCKIELSFPEAVNLS
jgi:hypothetical protein